MMGRGTSLVLITLSLSCYIDALLYSRIAVRAPHARASALVRTCRMPARATTVLARDDDDESVGEGSDLEIMIWITDPKMETPIRCYMESSTEVDGNLYALAHPVDIPVIIATCEDEEKGLNGLEDDAAIDAVFDIAKEVLREEGFELKRTPFMLTVEEDEEAFDLDETDDDDMAMYDDEDEEDETDLDEMVEGAEVSHAARRSRIIAPCPRVDRCCVPILCNLHARALCPTSFALATCWNLRLLGLRCPQCGRFWPSSSTQVSSTTSQSLLSRPLSSHGKYRERASRCSTRRRWKG